MFKILVYLAFLVIAGALVAASHFWIGYRSSAGESYWWWKKTRVVVGIVGVLSIIGQIPYYYIDKDRYDGMPQLAYEMFVLTPLVFILAQGVCYFLYRMMRWGEQVRARRK